MPVAPVPPTVPTPALDTSALMTPPPAQAAEDVDVDPVKTLELKPKIVDQLVTVFDPEIPVNIYELGLIYDILVDAKGLAVIKMTLTAPGCPAAVTLPAEVQGKVKSIEGCVGCAGRPGVGAALGQRPHDRCGKAATRDF